MTSADQLRIDGNQDTSFTVAPFKSRRPWNPAISIDIPARRPSGSVLEPAVQVVETIINESHSGSATAPAAGRVLLVVSDVCCNSAV